MRLYDTDTNAALGTHSHKAPVLTGTLATATTAFSGGLDNAVRSYVTSRLLRSHESSEPFALFLCLSVQVL